MGCRDTQIHPCVERYPGCSDIPACLPPAWSLRLPGFSLPGSWTLASPRYSAWSPLSAAATVPLHPLHTHLPLTHWPALESLLWCSFCSLLHKIAGEGHRAVCLRDTCVLLTLSGLLRVCSPASLPLISKFSSLGCWFGSVLLTLELPGGSLKLLLRPCSCPETPISLVQGQAGLSTGVCF